MRPLSIPQYIAHVTISVDGNPFQLDLEKGQQQHQGLQEVRFRFDFEGTKVVAQN